MTKNFKETDISSYIDAFPFAYDANEIASENNHGDVNNVLSLLRREIYRQCERGYTEALFSLTSNQRMSPFINDVILNGLKELGFEVELMDENDERSYYQVSWNTQQ